MLTNIQLNTSTDVSDSSESSVDMELKETLLSAAFVKEWLVSSTNIIV